MPAQKARDLRDWAGVRLAYEQGDGTIKQICERFGVTKGSLEHRCKKESWTSPRSTRAKRQASTLGRLFAVLETQVGKLANAGGETLGDKEAHQLTELIKNFDKMSSMADAEAKVEAPVQKRDMSDILDIREKLAKRFDQYNRR